MNYLYGHSWHPKLRKPVRPLTEKQARERWENGPDFCVAGGPDLEPGRVPEYSLVVGRQGQFVTATRYDQHGSVVAVYNFKHVDERPDDLFLKQVTLYTYPGEDRWYDELHCSAVATYQFRPDGSGQRRLTVKAAPADEVVEFEGVDVSDHWEAPITWGDWDRFGRDRTPALPERDPAGS